MLQNLPQVGPHTKHQTDGVEYDMTHNLLWLVAWLVMDNSVTTARVAGDKKAKMPSKDRPEFPWSAADNQGPKVLGSAGNHSQEEILAYLDNL